MSPNTDPITPIAAIEDGLRFIIADVLHKSPSEITLDLTWRVLGLDSLDIFDVLLGCETRFGLVIPDPEAIHLTTPRLMIDYISQRLIEANS